MKNYIKQWNTDGIFKVNVTMAKVNISFRLQPWHYRALKEELARGKTLTNFFEELLDEKFPVSSNAVK
jgi:hypothetical protein